MKCSVALVVLVLAALAACGTPEVSVRAPRGSLPATDVPLDALTRRHARLRERMEARGYAQAGPVARFFVLEGPGIVVPLDLETGACTTFVALGAAGLRDLSLALYDGRGDAISVDAVGGEGGLVHVCPLAEETGLPAPETSAFYLVIEAREGGGSVSVGQFRSDVGEGDGFEGIFDEVLAPRAPFGDVEAALGAARAALRGRGLEPLEAPIIEWVAEGAALRRPLQLEGGRCYVAVGRSVGVRDVDLFLFDPSGAEIERDLSEGSEPTVELCPDVAGRYTVEARAFEGQGGIGILVLAGAADVVQDSPPVAVETALEPDRRPGSEDAPDISLGVVAATLARLGFEAPVFASRDASIAPGEVRTHDIVVGPGCSLVVASGSHQAMDVDLYLADPSGRQIDEDTAVHASARVRACRDTATVMRVAVKAYGRSGSYALAVLRAPRAIRDVRALRIEEALARWRTAEGWAPVRRETLTLEEGALHAIEVTVPEAACIAVAAAGGEELRDVDLLLRDGEGRLLVSDSGPSAVAAVSRCLAASGVVRVETVAYTGSGPILLEILQGPSEVGPARLTPPREP